jgi:hypothetical protein
MSGERMQILDMLAQGKITADEAARLLDKVEGGQGAEGQQSPRESTEDESEEGPRPRPAGARAKFFRIKVTSTNGDKVNIRIPLAFVRAGIKLSSIMPEEARKRVEGRGIDLSRLSELKGEALEDALRELTVDVDDADGDVVRMYCE